MEYFMCFIPFSACIALLCIGFDIVLIDCEAGMEQISRKVVNSIGTLVITTDLSMRSAQTAIAIEKAAHRYTMAKKVGLIVNRVKDGEKSIESLTRETGIEVFGWIPEDNHISEWDLVGRPIINLPETSPSVLAVRKIMEKMNLPI